MVRTILSLLFIGLVSQAFSQTLFIDYSEHTEDNTASIHLIDSKLPIENETFDDIETAKTKLVRVIENYRTDGYSVEASNVSTHKHGRQGYHYHYQYILQKKGLADTDMGIEPAKGKVTPSERQNMRKQMMKEQSIKSSSDADQTREMKRKMIKENELQPKAPKPLPK